MIPNKVVIALGSNIEPEENLELAVVELESRFNVLMANDELIKDIFD